MYLLLFESFFKPSEATATAMNLISRIALAAASLLFIFAAHATPETPPIVDVNWLSAQLHQQDLIIVDARLADDYELGHIAGAVNIPYTQAFIGGYMMPTINDVREMFSAAGLTHQHRIVVYDDGEFIWAARIYWLLETFGHNKVSLLNVGYGNWPADTLPESVQAPAIQRSNFVPAVDHRRLETKLSTRLALNSPSHLIMDGRSAAEYLGEESQAKRYGHIPGAQNAPWSDNYVQSGTGNQMRPLHELAGLYEGLEPNKDIIVYCNGGAQSALNYIVLQALGYNVSVYDGSWFEWGNDEQVPIHNPSANP